MAGVLILPHVLGGAGVSSNLPAGFPVLPTGVYSIEICATAVPCVSAPGTYSDMDSLATALNDLENTGSGLCGVVSGNDHCTATYTTCTHGCETLGDYFDVNVDFTVCDTGPCANGHLLLRVMAPS